jgi:hypothetical protein
VAFHQGQLDGATWPRTRSASGGITAAASQRESGGPRRLVERLAVYLADPHRAPAPEAAVQALRAAEAVGFRSGR